VVKKSEGEGDLRGDARGRGLDGQGSGVVWGAVRSRRQRMRISDLDRWQFDLETLLKTAAELPGNVGELFYDIGGLLWILFEVVEGRAFAVIIFADVLEIVPVFVVDGAETVEDGTDVVMDGIGLAGDKRPEVLAVDIGVVIDAK